MEEVTLRALRGSIRKWRKIVGGTGADDGSKNCPLCDVFQTTNPAREQCSGCPVRERTGLRFCAGTPYSEWAASHQLKSFPLLVENDTHQKFALAELAFLESLLPEYKS